MKNGVYCPTCKKIVSSGGMDFSRIGGSHPDVRVEHRDEWGHLQDHVCPVCGTSLQSSPPGCLIAFLVSILLFIILCGVMQKPYGGTIPKGKALTRHVLIFRNLYWGEKDGEPYPVGLKVNHLSYGLFYRYSFESKREAKALSRRFPVGKVFPLEYRIYGYDIAKATAKGSKNLGSFGSYSGKVKLTEKEIQSWINSKLDEAKVEHNRMPEGK